MKNSNCNNRRPLWTIFTLFSFFLGLILYIILRQSKEDNKKDQKDTRGTVPSKREIPKKVNKVVEEEINVRTIRLSDRQDRAVKLLLEKGKVYPSELQELLSEVSARTIRRDMTDLEKKGLIEQKGTTKSTYYVYKGK